MKYETILGLTGLQPYGNSMHGYDSSACISDKAKITGAASEERFTRNKHQASFPWMSLNYVLSLGYPNEDIDAVAIPWPLKRKPPKKLKHPLQKFKEKNNTIKPALPIEKKKIVGINHQLAHASSTYRTSGFKKALSVSIDFNNFETDKTNTGTSIFTAENGKLTQFSESTANFSTFYAFVTEALGFKAIYGEEKTMELSPYGNPQTKAYNALKKYCSTVKKTKINKEKKKITYTVTVINNNQRFTFHKLETLHNLIKKFGYKDVAAAAQRILEEQTSELIENTLEQTGMDKLCLAGNVFLNSKLNKKLRELKRVKDIFIYPNPGEAGASVGAALEAHHELTGEKTLSKNENNAYLGPEYANEEIEATLKKHKNLRIKNTPDPSGDAAELVSRGKIIGWFQGRMEWSPRSLGARSVLAAPQDEKIKDKINRRLKQRDWFRSFAPSILSENARKYLKNPTESPYMNMSYDVQPQTKDEIAATVHFDNTVRPQTVTKKQNKLYHDLIKEYGKMTGTEAILNTSFNKHGPPNSLHAPRRNQPPPNERH